jgi:hypothetical protein
VHDREQLVHEAHLRVLNLVLDGGHRQWEVMVVSQHDIAVDGDRICGRPSPLLVFFCSLYFMSLFSFSFSCLEILSTLGSGHIISSV